MVHFEDSLSLQRVLGGYVPSDYETYRVQAPSHDGVLVSITLTLKKGVKRNSGAPILIYGYGAYGSCADPYPLSKLKLVLSFLISP